MQIRARKYDKSSEPTTYWFEPHWFELKETFATILALTGLYLAVFIIFEMRGRLYRIYVDAREEFPNSVSFWVYVVVILATYSEVVRAGLFWWGIEDLSYEDLLSSCKDLLSSCKDLLPWKDWLRNLFTVEQLPDGEMWVLDVLGQRIQAEFGPNGFALHGHLRLGL